MNMFYNILGVFLGGGAGCVLRYLAGAGAVNVLFVNILGGFLMGIFYVKSCFNPALKCALMAGFCGGLTTFSAFSLHMFKMADAAQYVQAAVYAIVSIVVCLAAVAAGGYLAKNMF